MTPSRSFTSLDIHALVPELNALVGARVQKAYQVGATVYLVLYLREKRYLLLDLHRAHFTEYVPQFPQKPSNFCMLLRKHLEGSKLAHVKQHGFDRVLELKFAGVTERTLVVELFSKGNLLLLNELGKIIQPARVEEWKHRVLKARQEYVYPPECVNVTTLALEEFNAALFRSNSDLVRTLATTLGFGGTYAEELCTRAGIEKSKKPVELTLNEIGILYQAVCALLEEAAQQGAYVFMENGELLDFAPVKLAAYKTAKQTERLSDAADEYYSVHAEAEVETKKDVARERYEERMVQQQELLKITEEEIKTLTAEANALAAKKEFKTSGKTYDRVKKLRKKIPGIYLAMADTKKKMTASPQEVKADAPQKRVLVKKAWHEKFRYFTSSDGFMVVAGKDATTNDILIKKHTEPADRVLHAEITGAPFTVIKAEGKEIPDPTVQEAATFAASYSKAWARGLGIVDVYAVTPDQVSKEAPAGESIGKGAFMIRGKKTYFRSTELVLAIGVKDTEVITGPETAVAARTKKYVLIGPGTEKSAELAKKIKKKLNVAIPLDDIQKHVPAGKGRLLR